MEGQANPICEKLAKVVGADHVHGCGETLPEHTRTLIPGAVEPLAVVFPGSTQEVQAIVRLAGEEGVPLWPVSGGRNWGYGTRTPGLAGAIVMVLRRMNRILEVDPELAYAVLEPGVSYLQLHEHLQAQGIQLMVDPTDSTPHGSVIGNALERGVGETPYGDHFGNLCGFQVVTPEGEVLETGGGPENLSTRHTYKWGTGPYLDGLFSQGNFGVVTRAGIWLMPVPEHYESVAFGLTDPADFPRLIDTLRELSLSGVLATKLHVLNDFVTLSVIGPYPRELLGQGETRLSDEARATMRARHGYKTWSFVAGLYGSPGKVAVAKGDLKRRLGALGNLRFLADGRAARLVGLSDRLKRWREGGPLARLAARAITRAIGVSPEVLAVAPHAHAMLRGVPTEHFLRHAYMKVPKPPPGADIDPTRDGVGLIWLAPAVPFTSGHVDAVRDLGRRLYREHGFDDYLALIMVNPRTVVALFSIYYDREDEAEVTRAQELYATLRDACLERGYQQYRTSAVGSRRVLDCAPEVRAFADRLKAAVDPAGVLAPGRYGVGLPADS